MSKASTKIDEENLKLRIELKKLRSELKEIKKTHQCVALISEKEKSKLICNIQEKLEQGIFSPPKKPANRPKSPIHGKKIRRSKSPGLQKRKSVISIDENKENFIGSMKKITDSPDFLKNKQETNGSEAFLSIMIPQNSDPCDTVQCDIDALQCLERENKLLRELNLLRAENEKLRLKLKEKTPKKQLRNASFSKISMKNKSKRTSVSINETNQSIHLQHSKSPSRQNLRKSSVPCNDSQEISKKSPKNLKNEKNQRFYNEKQPMSIEIQGKTFGKVEFDKGNTGSEVMGEQFSDVFSFTGSAKKSNCHSKSISISNLDFTATEQRSVILKSPSNGKKLSKSPSCTPRSRHCSKCDLLLHKGLSTSMCSIHFQ